MRYVIEHEIVVRCAPPVDELHCELRLTPLERDQHCRRIAMTGRPPATTRTSTDAFGNVVTSVTVAGAHPLARIRVDAEVETMLENPFEFALLPVAAERGWLAARIAADPTLHELVRHRSAFSADPIDLQPGLDLPVWDQGVGLLEALLSASAWVASELRYVTQPTPATSLGAVLAQGGGDCWDFAHLLIAVVRRWGVPARLATGFVDSGYDSAETPCRLGLHAWADVLIPGGGWRGIDATHGLVANDTYVPVAVGRDGLDVPVWCGDGCAELGVHRVRQI